MTENPADNRSSAYSFIGDTLREYREKKKLSIDDVVRSTKIRGIYIEDMERGRFDSLPSGFYIKGYIKSYAECLKIDPQPLLDRYENADRGFFEYDGDEAEAENKKQKQRPDPSPANQNEAMPLKTSPVGTRNTPNTGLIVFSILAIAGVYFAWVAYNNYKSTKKEQEFVIMQPQEDRTEQIINTFTNPNPTVVILANEEMELTIHKANGEIFDEMVMGRGDTYFVPNSIKGLAMSVGNLSAVEVYIDGDKVSSLNNLDKNEHGLILDINKLYANLEIVVPE